MTLFSFIFCSFALFMDFFLPWGTLNMLTVKDKRASLWRYLPYWAQAGHGRLFQALGQWGRIGKKCGTSDEWGLVPRFFPVRPHWPRAWNRLRPWPPCVPLIFHFSRKVLPFQARENTSKPNFDWFKELHVYLEFVRTHWTILTQLEFRDGVSISKGIAT